MQNAISRAKAQRRGEVTSEWRDIPLKKNLLSEKQLETRNPSIDVWQPEPCIATVPPVPSGGIPCAVTFVLFVALATFCVASVRAEIHIYCADHNNKKLIKIKEDGTLLWEFPNNNGHDVQLLKNGNLLIVTGEVQEVTPDKKIVWRVGRPTIRKCRGGAAAGEWEHGDRRQWAACGDRAGCKESGSVAIRRAEQQQAPAANDAASPPTAQRGIR